jgi:hypothetical protein
MSFLIPLAKSSLRLVLWLAAASGIIYLSLLAGRSALQSHFCPTERLATISDVSGFDFEVSRTDCDMIAKEVWISVFASKPGQAGKALVFEYDPFWYERVPLITSLDQHTVKISIPKVSSVLFQRASWISLSIVYDIGVVVYPDEKPERK